MMLHDNIGEYKNITSKNVYSNSDSMVNKTNLFNYLRKEMNYAHLNLETISLTMDVYITDSTQKISRSMRVTINWIDLVIPNLRISMKKVRAQLASSIRLLILNFPSRIFLIQIKIQRNILITDNQKMN